MVGMKSASTTHRNIRTISAIEREVLAQRSFAARVGDLIANHAGRMWFIAAHAVWFAIWIGLNMKGHGSAFDPFPFALLTMIVSLESIFLSLFILMSQNRSSQQADQRNHLDLQINLLSEHENTKMLQMLVALCEHHGLAISKDQEISELARRTEPREVIEDIKSNLPTHEQ
jgi:uncharacterized membrane protein